MEFLNAAIPLGIWIFLGFAIMTIADKTNTENGWMAFIPLLNVYLMFKIADVPMWWLILLLVPLVNIYIIIKVLIGIAHARGKSGWFALILFLPVINLLGWGALAFSD